MDCNQAIDLISAYADGELDASQRAQAQAHIDQCPQCGHALQSISALKLAMQSDGLKFNAPGALLNRVNSLLDKAVDPPGTKPAPRAPRILRPKWIVLGSAAVLAAAIAAILVIAWPTAQKRIESDAVARYQQTAAAGSLVDIASSDPKTVTAWFAGKVSFTPFLPAQAPTGYTLAGGRVDHFEGQTVATLVYRNAAHVAQISQWPGAAAGSASGGSAHSSGGLNVSSWSSPGMDFVAVSNDSQGSAEQLPNLFAPQVCGPR